MESCWNCLIQAFEKWIYQEILTDRQSTTTIVVISLRKFLQITNHFADSLNLFVTTFSEVALIMLCHAFHEYSFILISSQA